MGWFVTLVLHGFTTLEIAVGCAVVIHRCQTYNQLTTHAPNVAFHCSPRHESKAVKECADSRLNFSYTS